MATNAGQAGGSGTDTIQFPDTGGTATSPGDAVAISSGDLIAGTDTEDLLGVRARGRSTEDGDVAPVHVSGPCVAAVNGAVTAGSDLDLGTTGGDGELETSSGGPAHALSDENGSWNGQTAPAGYAWVLL